MRKQPAPSHKELQAAILAELKAIRGLLLASRPYRVEQQSFGSFPLFGSAPLTEARGTALPQLRKALGATD